MKTRTVLLCVTGSIAAFKAVEIARELSRRGVVVKVAMTEAANEFIAPLTFEALLGSPVATGLFSGECGPIPHISLAESCDAMLVAPATADAIAKLVYGFGDDIVSSTALACAAPLIVAPAMHENMWLHPATQANIEILKSRGAMVVGPERGDLASGGKGSGRMADPSVIVGVALGVLGKSGDLAGRKVVVTAGGTQEPIDPVRCVTNRSSGKMGYAVAEAARDRGAEVILISAPTAVSRPAGVSVVRVTTAAEMLDATRTAVEGADALIMAAAVADYRPAHPEADKIKKDRAEMTIPLERTVDILGSLHGDYVRVGFAAESSNLERNAQTKLTEKQLHFIVGNDITAEDSGFGSDTNRVTIMDRDGTVERLPVLSKREVADRILDRVVPLLT